MGLEKRGTVQTNATTFNNVGSMRHTQAVDSIIRRKKGENSNDAEFFPAFDCLTVA